jgi:MarR family transcriptional regulator, transcriptional regulator for hemolysin
MSSAIPVRRTLGSLLQDSSRLMRRHFVNRAREVGLPIKRSEAAVLVRVDREPGTSQIQLAEQMDLDPIALVRLIDSLQERGLIERRPHAHDRRIRTLWLTEAAQPILEQVQAVAAEVLARALEGIPEMERKRLLDLLAMVRSNLATPAPHCSTAGSPVVHAGRRLEAGTGEGRNHEEG